MATSHQPVTDYHPLRELICPAIEVPLQPLEQARERRQGHRFGRRLPGALEAGDTERQVTCLDIGFGGVKIVASESLTLAPGTPVTITIELGPRVFRDECAVVKCEATARGTVLHLRL